MRLVKSAQLALGAIALAPVVLLACDNFPGTAPPPRTAQQQPAPTMQQPPPGYYYPPPPGYTGYYPPPQPSYPPQPYPTQTAPAPTQTAPAPSTAPSTAPSQQPPGYNPWVTLLGDLLKGGAPPIPWPNQPAPTPTTPPTPTPTPTNVDTRGLELANAINQYRQQNGLAAIPISKSLAKVADAHVKDLDTALPMAAQCNDHSWTNRGTWTPCCYTADHAQAKCMWLKPAELTPFKGTGFEISIGQPGEKKPGLILDAKQAITFWSSSSVHNDVMLNKGQWASMTWKAMGAGITDNHASAWFSDQTDSVTELKKQ